MLPQRNQVWFIRDISWNEIACTNSWTHTSTHSGCGVNASSLVLHPLRRPPNPAPSLSSLFLSVQLPPFFFLYSEWCVGPLTIAGIGKGSNRFFPLVYNLRLCSQLDCLNSEVLVSLICPDTATCNQNQAFSVCPVSLHHIPEIKLLYSIFFHFPFNAPFSFLSRKDFCFFPFWVCLFVTLISMTSDVTLHNIVCANFNGWFLYYKVG